MNESGAFFRIFVISPHQKLEIHFTVFSSFHFDAYCVCTTCKRQLGQGYSIK